MNTGVHLEGLAQRETVRLFYGEHAGEGDDPCDEVTRDDWNALQHQIWHFHLGAFGTAVQISGQDGWLYTLPLR